jgi:hypothetical protein
MINTLFGNGTGHIVLGKHISIMDGTGQAQGWIWEIVDIQSILE